MRLIKKVLKRILFGGNKYICPICQTRLGKFYWIGRENEFFNALGGVLGAGKRRGGCFKCNSTDKERLLFVYLEKKIPEYLRDSRFSVLHFGPEKPVKKLFESFVSIDYNPVDYYAEGYSYDHDVKQMDVQNILLKDASVNLLICCHVLEHVGDVETALKEIHRVLKPGGTAILQVPLAVNLKRTMELELIIEKEIVNDLIYGQGDHLRLFGLDYLDMITEAGFEVDKYNFEGQSKFGIPFNDFLIVATK